MGKVSNYIQKCLYCEKRHDSRIACLEYRDRMAKSLIPLPEYVRIWNIEAFPNIQEYIENFDKLGDK